MQPPRAVAVVVDGPKVLIIKRYLKHRSSAACVMCEEAGLPGPACPGHHYAVLPGGGVEAGETHEEAAVRELWEETTLTGRIDRLAWSGRHNGRPASYFVMRDISGTPVLSGDEALAHGPNDHFELKWVTAGEFDRLNLHPADVRERLGRLLEHSA